MAILLMILGALSACAGVAAIAYGMPIKEFSLGNTLILSGTTALVGGVLIVAVGAAVRQLREIADGLASRPIGGGVARADLPPPLAPITGQATGQAARSAGAPGRIAFPTRPKPSAGDSKKADERARDPKPEAVVPPLAFETAPFARPPEEERPAPIVPPPLEEIVPEPLRSDPVVALAPELRTAATIETDQALQERREAAWQDARDDARDERNETDAAESAGDGRPAEQEGFDSIWDRDARPAAPVPEEPRAEAPEFIRRVKSPAEPRQESRFEQRFESPPELPSEPRSAPILKSGVVDGMGYTLYVDGSIEAELPQGTVRFASIAELREHLEKNG
ncbi:MAG: hypothetical protein J0H78_02470 [Rhizobiales bacterium]|nr:hypothetical protein [Hyphomicrobiales bacterium]OJY43133.1 MAG: hypothetical protein BGP08_20925 [Rhizobiales bacterium 64-17]